MSGIRPAWSPDPVADLHAGGAVMWIGGAAIMLGFMMLVFLMWAHADGAGTASRGWLEAVRSSSFQTLVAPAERTSAERSTSADRTFAEPAPAEPTPAVAGARGTIDDDEHLAAYNAYLARLNQSGHGPAR